MNKNTALDLISVIDNTRHLGNTLALQTAAKSAGGILMLSNARDAKLVRESDFTVPLVTTPDSVRLMVAGKRMPLFIDNSVVYDLLREYVDVRTRLTDAENTIDQLSRV